MQNLFNHDAEIALLSIILKAPEIAYNLQLKDFMFSSTPNKVFFGAIEEIKSKNLNPEPMLIIETLKSHNLLDAAGGSDYINYLSGQPYEVANAQEFAKIILDSYKARSVISLASTVPTMVNGGNVDDVIGSIKRSLDGLSTTDGGEGVVDLKDALKDTWEDVVKKTTEGSYVEVTTGFEQIDGVTGGYRSGDLWIVAARPSQGKTAIMCNSALNTAKKGSPVFIESLEMNKISLAHRFLAADTGIPITNIRFGLLNNEQLKILAKSVEDLKNLPIYIDTSYSADINYIVSTVKKYHASKGIKVMFLDYIQLLVDRGMYATHELGQVSRELKLLSNSLGITSVILSQLNRSVEGRDDKRPVLSDLRQSGNLEEDADLALFIYRDVVYNSGTKNKEMMELIIRKHRNGPIGMVPMSFNAESNKIW